ncbi:hypothetical protein [Thiomicrorhabdus sp.]|uniref:hypothetical protein n=1 Tax=Thiomicrorhabdus sp. TaxID=2039724 RepID=UPI003563E254
MNTKVSLNKDLFVTRSDRSRKNKLSFKERMDRSGAWVNTEEILIKEVKPGFITIIHANK